MSNDHLRPLTILVVDDEPKIRDLVRRYLEADGFAVIEADDGTTALEAFERDQPDMVVLDVMMPVLGGLEVLRRIRTTSDVPVLLLTALEEEIDKVVGLTAGADDYVTKPFGGRELAARLRAIQRRSRTRLAPAVWTTEQDGPDLVLHYPELTIDVSRRHVVRGNETVSLTAMDFELLVCLARSSGRVLTRRQLLASVWDDDAFVEERVVDVHVRTLRRALSDDATRPTVIETVRSVGYRFLPQPV
ncbi:response regulator transcription factor [Streptomyces sp. NPDC059627]